jgi:hypothetical protein
MITVVGIEGPATQQQFAGVQQSADRAQSTADSAHKRIDEQQGVVAFTAGLNTPLTERTGNSGYGFTFDVRPAIGDQLRLVLGLRYDSFRGEIPYAGSVPAQAGPDPQTSVPQNRDNELLRVGVMFAPLEALELEGALQFGRNHMVADQGALSQRTDLQIVGVNPANYDISAFAWGPALRVGGRYKWIGGGVDLSLLRNEQSVPVEVGTDGATDYLWYASARTYLGLYF